jgi:hypothetical protein
MHDGLSGQVAPTTWPVLNNKWLAEAFRKRLADQTSEDVAPSHKANDDPHWPPRIVLRGYGTQGGRQRNGAGDEMKESSALRLHARLPSRLLRHSLPARPTQRQFRPD